jgi:hypothetical protein
LSPANTEREDAHGKSYLREQTNGANENIQKKQGGTKFTISFPKLTGDQLQ